ncbi:MAG: replication initiation protein, partial [Pseudomonadales bacterium]|nr:replication initiation protein [Pseudomonadales bacterium]
WDVFNHFSGKYEAIIYKLCKDYIGVGRTPYMTIDELREYMGVKPSEYAEFMKLNEWVIKKPIKSINDSQISDIIVEAIYNRNGRKVIGIHFTVQLKNQASFPFVEPQSNPAFTCAKVSIPISAQEEYLAAHTAEQISLSIERANQYCEQLEKKQKSVNYGAIYKVAIAENWGQQFEEQRTIYAEIKAKKIRNKTRENEELLVDKTQNKSDWAMINQRFLERLKSLPEDEQHALIVDCIKAQKPVFKTMARNNYEKFQLDVLEKPSFTALLWPYLAERWNEPIEGF